MGAALLLVPLEDPVLHDPAQFEEPLLVVDEFCAGVAREGVVLPQEDRLLGTDLLAEAAVDAAEHVDLEPLGALLDPRNREVLQRHGILVCLTAKMGTLLERLKEDLSRPLLAGANPEQKIELLMKERESIYNLCPIQVATDGKTIAQVAAEIIQKLPSTWMS